MTSLNRRQWLRSAGLATGAATLWSQNLFSLNNIKPFDDQANEFRSADDNIIRLSSNENPYGPSPFVREKIIPKRAARPRHPPSERCRHPSSAAASTFVRRMFSNRAPPQSHAIAPATRA